MAKKGMARMACTSILALGAAMLAQAAAPNGYYSRCEGLGGRELLEALEATISDHVAVGYNGLWDLYATSDTRPDGTIWDMYSTKHWITQKDQCGTYSAVGDCYNREHSMPKSWFDDAQPMYCDAFHIYPTDGKVNGQRSNYPYGECAYGSTLPSSGGVKALGKLGTSTFPGYSGVVFEPDDEYKGDFARSYFYMAACYNRLIDDWHSDMLAGNSYPAFTGWALNLLLKWHRQDPVSDKERDRNDAVYAKQRNRNPFIDHPEMAEYIWGDKTSLNWTSSGKPDPMLALPLNGSAYDFGYVTVGGEKSITIPVKGANLDAPVVLTSADPWFTVDRDRIPAAEANSSAGAAVVVTWDAEEAGVFKGELAFSSGAARASVALAGVAVDGLTVQPAADVTDRSFEAVWTYVGDECDDGAYVVHCQASGLPEITKRAPAKDGRCEVDGLQPSTRYSYWVESRSMKSNVVELVTSYPIPSIQLLCDGDLFLEARPGEPSQPYELIVDADNIDADIEITVSEPFQLSSDKDAWSTSLAIKAEEDRFYLRVYTERAGAYATTIRLQAGDYLNDDIEASALVGESRGFIEDFEADADGCDTYGGCEFMGSAATWSLLNAGIWEADKNDARSGIHCLRMGKNSDSSAAMLSDKTRGIGVVTLYAKRWTASDGDCEFVIEYSMDGGASWQRTTPAAVTQDEYQEFSFAVNQAGQGRIRVQQTAGKRFVIDDIAIGDYEDSGLQAGADGGSWDAYCRGGLLVIEAKRPQAAKVYGVDGIVHFDGELPAGSTELRLPKGLYVVALGDFGRRVMVK